MKEIELENFSNSKIPILLWFSLYLKKIRIYIFLKILQINSYDCLHSWLFNYIFINRFWKKSLLMWFFLQQNKTVEYGKTRSEWNSHEIPQKAYHEFVSQLELQKNIEYNKIRFVVFPLYD